MVEFQANTARALERTAPHLAVVQADVAPPASERLLNVREVAARLAVTPRHISNLVTSDRFPQPIRLGRSTRWRPSDVALFLSVDGDMDRFEAESKR